MAKARKTSWDEMNLQILSDNLSRKYVDGDSLTLARINLKKGTVVPEHRHPNEQISWVLQGELLIEIDGEEFDLKEGELLIIPPNAPHKSRALEETVDIDIFTPTRSDWSSGNDQYLRK